MPLRDLWPEPEILPLGPGVHPVSCLTLRDLAAIERWACGMLGSARTLAAEAVQIEDADARKWALYRAYERAKNDGPHIEESDVSALLDRPEGVCVQLWLSIRHGDPEFTQADAIDLAPQVELGQWQRFVEVAWHLHPLDRIAATIDAEIGVTFPLRSSPVSPGQWVETIGKLVEHTHWPLDRIGDLTIGQFQGLFGGERKHPVAQPIRPKGWTKEEFHERVQAPRKAFWADWFASKRKKVTDG